MKKPELIILGIDGAMPSYVKEQVKNGKLKGFARLMEKGAFFEDMMTVFPSITPTCWSAISCGAVPSVTGALCHQVHQKGAHPVSYVTPYNSVNVKAERFWEAAARKGKRSLILEVPSSGPVKCEGVLQVLGGTTYTPDRCPADTHRYGVPQQIFKNTDETVISGTLKTRAGTFESISAKTDFLSDTPDIYRFHPVYSDKRYDVSEVEAHEWWIRVAEDGVRIGISEQDVASRPVTHAGEWTEVFTRKLKTSDGDTVPFHFRARLDAFDKASGQFAVFVTEGKNLYKEISPESLAVELAEIPETLSPDYSALSKRSRAELDKFFESERFAYNWHKMVILHCMEKYQPDIIFDYSGSTDTVNHIYRNAYEGLDEGAHTDPRLATEAYERVYAQADEHICWLLDNVADENTYFAVVSDHGSVGYSDHFEPWTFLQSTGLLTINGEPSGSRWKSDIDWQSTKAYPVGSCYINVNLKGREPTGTVEPEDYEKTVNEIITTLYTRGHTFNGAKFNLAFAVPGDQAGFIGHGGEDCGDVVYGIVGSHVGGYIGGVHSHQIPSARSTTGDIRSLCLISGPNIKKNVTVTRPTDLTDIAPTLCYALGYPQPRDATGGVIFSVLTDEGESYR